MTYTLEYEPMVEDMTEFNNDFTFHTTQGNVPKDEDISYAAVISEGRFCGVVHKEDGEYHAVMGRIHVGAYSSARLAGEAICLAYFG